MSQKLRELIRSVRACKTAAEERAAISKECALIRTAFKDEDTHYRHRNIAKLIYISMLGYPTHFGQLETLKLIASPKFSDKRVGYLGMALLIEDHSEFLTMVTNHLSQDMVHTSNIYICGLALGAMGNVGSGEMLRDLSQNLAKLLDTRTEPFVRKKVLLCFGLLFQHEPELALDFIPKISALLNETNHGVLLCALQCLTQTCYNNEPAKKQIRKQCLLHVIRMLKKLANNDGFQPEYEVNGHNDPHLQVACLQFLQVCGHEHAKASEEMQDVLAQVATNTDASKNAGNAILNQVVRTIMGIECDAGLRVLGGNILGRFLGNKDANIKYVALVMLSKLVLLDFHSVARHRNTIVQCLRDPDVSIRNRALDCAFLLLDDDSVEELMGEIVVFLASSEVKPQLASRIADAVLERFSHKPLKWRMDVLLDVLTVVAQAPRRVWRDCVSLIASQDEALALRPHIVHRLFSSLHANVQGGEEEVSHQGLFQVGLWVMGEYGDFLLQAPPSSCAESGFDCHKRSEEDVLDCLDNMLRRHDADLETKGMALVTMLKLSVRFKQAKSKERLTDLLGRFKTSMQTELQCRSVEFSQLIGMEEDALLNAILKAMPPGGKKGGKSASEQPQLQFAPAASTATAAPQTAVVKSSLIDLDDLFGSVSISSSSAPPPLQPVVPMAAPADHLMDLFGGGVSAVQPLPVVIAAAPPPPSRMMHIYNEHGLEIALSLNQPAIAPGNLSGQFIVSTSQQHEFTNLVLQVAVPKYMTVKLLPASGHQVGPHTQLTQTVEFANPADKPYTMKIKVSFTNDMGEAMVGMAVASEFPRV